MIKVASQGQPGRAGKDGTDGRDGTTPSVSIGSVTTLAAGSAATASITAGGVLSFGIPSGANGTNGSNAAATPLGSATPKPLGTAAAGASGNAAREDHVHPLAAGRLELVGNLNVGETLLLSLAVGMKRKDFALAGVTSADANKLVLLPNGTPTSGCEAVNAYPGATAGQVSIGYYTPLLAIGATYSIPVSIYRIAA